MSTTYNPLVLLTCWAKKTVNECIQQHNSIVKREHIRWDEQSWQLIKEIMRATAITEHTEYIWTFKETKMYRQCHSEGVRRAAAVMCLTMYLLMFERQFAFLLLIWQWEEPACLSSSTFENVHLWNGWNGIMTIVWSEVPNQIVHLL